jgi:hypothetical protein
MVYKTSPNSSGKLPFSLINSVADCFDPFRRVVTISPFLDIPASLANLFVYRFNNQPLTVILTHWSE